MLHVDYQLEPNSTQLFRITSTLKHPFWVKDLGWTSAENLYKEWRVEKWLELHDGRNAKAFRTTDIYVSDQPGIGWIPTFMGDSSGPGVLWDFDNKKLVAKDVHALDAIRFEEHPDPILKLPVYNIEVEDFHTYYVGEHGVWVHNRNCGGINFEVVGDVEWPPTLIQDKVFQSSKELLPYFKANGITSGEVLIKAGQLSQADQLVNIPLWLRHEETVQGRLKASDGSLYEYGILFKDDKGLPIGSDQAQLDIIRVEAA